jgi:hypothetical protein
MYVRSTMIIEREHWKTKVSLTFILEHFKTYKRVLHDSFITHYYLHYTAATYSIYCTCFPCLLSSNTLPFSYLKEDSQK